MDVGNLGKNINFLKKFLVLILSSTIELCRLPINNSTVYPSFYDISDYKPLY